MIRKIFIAEALLIAIVLSIVMQITWSWFWFPIVVFVGSYFGLMGCYFILLFIISLFFSTKKEYITQNKLVNSVVVNTMELLDDLAHLKIKTTGLEMIPHDQKYMLVYNHTSNYDPIVQTVVLRNDNLVHLSKKENFDIPIAGNWISRNCYVALDRKNARKDLRAISRASKYISDGKYCVGVAPEGTRNKVDINKMLPFKEGCFNLARMAKCPIVVCEMHGFTKISKNFPFKPTTVEMNVLKVISYDEIKDLKAVEISSIVYKLIQDKIDSRNKGE